MRIRHITQSVRLLPYFEGHPYTPQQDKPVSARTVQCHVRALKAFSSWLHAEGYSTENRLKNLKLPKAPAGLVQPLTAEEIESISSVFKKESPTGFRNYPIFVTALDSGLRASEIAGISLSQVNLRAGCIKVVGKGAKERMVPIGKFVGMTLWHYIEDVRPEGANSDIDELFLSRDGKRITANTIKLVFSGLAKSSGVERLHAHLCRHTFAINYLLNGGDIFSLREILGRQAEGET
jgi:site-specific recombinase XerD